MLCLRLMEGVVVGDIPQSLLDQTLAGSTDYHHLHVYLDHPGLIFIGFICFHRSYKRKLNNIGLGDNCSLNISVYYSL